jgi:hypothetical protein
MFKQNYFLFFSAVKKKWDRRIWKETRKGDKRLKEWLKANPLSFKP